MGYKWNTVLGPMPRLATRSYSLAQYLIPSSGNSACLPARHAGARPTSGGLRLILLAGRGKLPAMSMSLGEASLTKIFAALRFAAEKHTRQRRKGDGQTPYINHPVGVLELLWRVGGVRDPDVLAASLLHDAVEDTDATLDEIGEMFGPAVRALVAEITDDKYLPKAERKRLQIERAPALSPGAKLIRLADKCLNVYDVAYAPPAGWPHERRAEYLRWTERVVAGVRGCNAALESHYDAVLGDARAKLNADAARG